MMIKNIDIGTDFGLYVGPRFIADGEFSGEAFREQHLIPALEKHASIVVHLDSVKGYTASFLEEAFGGLVRKQGPDVLQRVHFVAVSRAYLAEQIKDWMREAADRIGQKKAPKGAAR